MVSPTPAPVEDDAASLISQFLLDRLLNQDQAGRRISLLGTIADQPALLIAERAAFATDDGHLRAFASSLRRVQTLGHNDIYRWCLASSSPPNASSDERDDGDHPPQQPPDLKLNLIYPCTPQHVQKYSTQGVRIVTETPALYARHVRPWVAARRAEGRLDWVFNILDGRAEQADVVYRERGAEEGFVLLPDLNWDRATLTSLHLLALVERRDLWSVRDLRRRHLPWLRHMQRKLLEATVALHPELETDQLKLYLHYQPTYHHMHIHIVHVLLDAGATQATGKALGLENVIAQLEGMGRGVGMESDDDDERDGEAGMADVSLTYTLGEESELWRDVFGVLKAGGEPAVGG